MSLLRLLFPGIFPGLRPKTGPASLPLPKVPSALLLLSLECLDDALRCGRYVYDADCWHFPQSGAARFTGPPAPAGGGTASPGQPVVLTEVGRTYTFPAGGVEGKNSVDLKNLTRIDLSGALMVRMNAPHGSLLKPSDFPAEWERRFQALTFLQRGMTRVAGLKWDRCRTRPPVAEYDVPLFREDPGGFFRILRHMAKDFYGHGA